MSAVSSSQENKYKPYAAVHGRLCARRLCDDERGGVYGRIVKER